MPNAKGHSVDLTIFNNRNSNYTGWSQVKVKTEGDDRPRENKACSSYKVLSNFL